MSIREVLERVQGAVQSNDPYTDRQDFEPLYAEVRTLLTRFGDSSYDQAVLRRDWGALNRGRFHTREEANEFFQGVSGLVEQEALHRVQLGLGLITPRESQHLSVEIRPLGPRPWSEGPHVVDSGVGDQPMRPYWLSPFGMTLIQGALSLERRLEMETHPLPFQTVVREPSDLARFIRGHLELPFQSRVLFRGVQLMLSFNVAIGLNSQRTNISANPLLSAEALDPILSVRSGQSEEVFPVGQAPIHAAQIPIPSENWLPRPNGFLQSIVSQSTSRMGGRSLASIPADRPSYPDVYTGRAMLQDYFLSEGFTDEVAPNGRPFPTRVMRLNITYETEHQIRFSLEAQGRVGPILINSYTTVESMLLSKIRPLPAGTHLLINIPVPRSLIRSAAHPSSH